MVNVLILQITGKLGSRIPTITLVSQGIFGRNAVSEEFEEVSLEAKTKNNKFLGQICMLLFMRTEVDILQVQWEFIENDEARLNHGNENRGVLLTVGFLPGLKVSLIPLLSKTQVTFYSNIALTYFRNKSVMLRGC